ncbi:hypothetical protein HEK616_43630 [Streptomyces nigrescens]|uniref:Uncharacterized protein n=1 Tax=Streptomyces nigrescens TaxID=1920 RepID=A0ABM7ZWY9_STRNI|nr:hypothetical protein HEK616_43630 [Streptomyces nigrescens]
MSGVERLLAEAGGKLHVRRRAFDVGAGLRRLAEDAGYVPPAGDVPPVSRARQQLSVVVRWVLDQPDAAVHVERLAEAIGRKGGTEDGAEEGAGGGTEDCTALLVNEGDLEDLDVDGAQVFACMLSLADHPESAQFWWQFAAGAGNRAAAYCLHLHHLGRGEVAEAEHWIDLLQNCLDGPDDAFVQGMGLFATYVRRNCPPVRVREPGLTAEVERLATREETDDVLVCRPDRAIARRLQDCAQHR